LHDEIVSLQPAFISKRFATKRKHCARVPLQSVFVPLQAEIVLLQADAGLAAHASYLHNPRVARMLAFSPPISLKAICRAATLAALQG